MKVVVIVLVVIAILFIVFAIRGSSANASGPKTKDDFHPKDYPTMDAFNGVLAPFAPKLALAQKTFDLSRVNPGSSVGVTVPPDKDHKFRNAKFNLTPTSIPKCAQIEYKAPDGDGDKLNDQKWPTDDDKDVTHVSFTILQSGGLITFTRNTPAQQPCIVQLQ
jgi:hypothetical protein